jgi:DNA-binding NtrC family response regulator
VGGTREIVVDVRVVALTNRDLQAMVREKTFRNDLFYRLNVFPLLVPPLRERSADILPLARHFLASLQPRLGRRFDGFETEAEARLLAYSWPGNVRELRNVVERAMVLERGPRISPRSLVLDWAGMPEGAVAAVGGSGASAMPPGIVPLEQMEREMVARAMRATGDNQTRAAELLGITRDQLRYRLDRFGMRGSAGAAATDPAPTAV